MWILSRAKYEYNKQGRKCNLPDVKEEKIKNFFEYLSVKGIHLQIPLLYLIVVQKSLIDLDLMQFYYKDRAFRFCFKKESYF